MINAKELRIGNWVYGVSDRVETIASISESSCQTSLIGVENSTPLENLSPIPITEDILLKLGFGVSDRTSKYKIWMTSKDEEFGLIQNSAGFTTYYNQKTKYAYVHQLQNIFFDLTGKELVSE